MSKKFWLLLPTSTKQGWKLQNSHTCPSDKCDKNLFVPTTLPLGPWKNNVLLIAQMLGLPQFRQMGTFPLDNHP